MELDSILHDYFLDFNMYNRTLYRTIHTVSDTFPVLLLTGPRQVGKSTLLDMCRDSARHYVTLDDLDVRQLAKNDPGLFVQTYKPPLIIDEVQYAPELLSYIKIVVDKQQSNGLFWLTGSQKFHLMRGIHESLAGRVAIIDVLGLSQSELRQNADACKPFMPTPEWIAHARQTVHTPLSMDAVYHTIWQGAFPRLHTQNTDRDIFYRSYIQTYIQRDVRDVLNISDDMRFYNFLVGIAARTGQLLNYADLSRDVGIDAKTAKSWVSILETSGLVYLLHPYYHNVSKRLVTSTPKIYFLDTGLCAYLTKWTDAQSLSVGAMSGHILETYMFTEILKSYWHNGKQPHFYYYRNADQNEIDLVIETGDTLYPTEFKKTGTPSHRASKHFHLLEKLDKKLGHGCVICFTEKDIPLSREVTAIPVGYLG